MSPKRKPKNACGTIFVLGAVLLLGLIFALSGADPLGIFTSTPEPDGSPAEVTDLPASADPTLPPASSSADWWQVYFVTPQRIPAADEVLYGEKGLPPEILKGSITEKLIQHIDTAQTTIHIVSFETDLMDVANALIRAKKRGVDVRWITDDENGILADKKPGGGQFAKMKKAGIKIIDDGRGALMHDKFWLFDDHTVWTGSTNITVSGMFEQDNNVIVIKSQELSAIYERQFEEMWAGNFNAKTPSTVGQQSLTIDGTRIQALFSPEDDVINQLLPYINNAKKSIRFMAFTYTQPDMGQAMLAAAKKGISVSGVFETVGADSEYGELTALHCAKIPVRTDGNFAFMHHKVIVIDNRIVITGSLNFTDNATENNNENMLVIDNPAIARLYTAEFQRVWDAGKDPSPEKFGCK